jgi:peptide/nickel transport system permease protein
VLANSVPQAGFAKQVDIPEDTAWRVLWRILCHNRNTPIGLGILTLVTLTALLAPWLAPHDPLEQDLMARLQPPSWVERGDLEYLLGTDDFGRDVLSRLVHGSRISLLVGLGVIVLSGSVGVAAGLAAGYLGGWTEGVIMRLSDAQQALPGLLFAIVLAAILGGSLTNVILVLVLSSWPVFARITYSAVRSLKEREFVWASVATGASVQRILFRHILPNVIPTVLIIAALQMGRTILAEAAPSWGGMVSEGRHLLQVAPWMATYPGLAIAITVWAINLLGDGLRQALDPRLRGLD